MNIYQGGGTFRGKIISIKRHYPSLIWETIPASIGSGHPGSIHMRLQSTSINNCNMYNTLLILTLLYIITHLTVYSVTK